jgi:hypothetical protein
MRLNTDKICGVLRLKTYVYYYSVTTSAIRYLEFNGIGRVGGGGVVCSGSPRCTTSGLWTVEQRVGMRQVCSTKRNWSRELAMQIIDLACSSLSLQSTPQRSISDVRLGAQNVTTHHEHYQQWKRRTELTEAPTGCLPKDILKLITEKSSNNLFQWYQLRRWLAVFWVAAPCRLAWVLPTCTAQQPRRQPTSNSPPWGPQVRQQRLLQRSHLVRQLSNTIHILGMKSPYLVSIKQ